MTRLDGHLPPAGVSWVLGWAAASVLPASNQNPSASETVTQVVVERPQEQVVVRHILGLPPFQYHVSWLSYVYSGLEEPIKARQQKIAATSIFFIVIKILTGVGYNLFFSPE